VAFVLVAWAGLAMAGFPRWLVVLVGITGIIGIIETLVYFVTSAENEVYLLLLILDASLILIVFFAVAWAFWRGPRSRDSREASPRVGRLGDR
jgi:phosphotransferase system  glucose/maltose/N-acetylglucosamine-specific IIC component